MTLTRTTPADLDYQRLIVALDRELAVTDGKDHAFYHQFNGSEAIRHVILLREEGQALACGAIKHYAPGTVEVKRMYTVAEARGRGLAGRVVGELERWATELGYQRLILETGVRQHAAIRLYTKLGYRRMAENYGPYRGVTNSVCMEKTVQVVSPNER